MDKTAVSGVGTYMFNDIHENGEGATIGAQELSRTLGIPYNPHIHATVVSVPPIPNIAITFNNTWGAFVGNNSIPVKTARDKNITVCSGGAQPNASVSLQVGTVVDVASRPIGRSILATVMTSEGPARVQIFENGTIFLEIVPTTGGGWVSFDSLSWIINNALN